VVFAVEIFFRVVHTCCTRCDTNMTEKDGFLGYKSFVTRIGFPKLQKFGPPHTKTSRVDRRFIQRDPQGMACSVCETGGGCWGPGHGLRAPGKRRACAWLPVLCVDQRYPLYSKVVLGHACMTRAFSADAASDTGLPPAWVAGVRSHGRAMVMLGWTARGDCDAFFWWRLVLAARVCARVWPRLNGAIRCGVWSGPAQDVQRAPHPRVFSGPGPRLALLSLRFYP
jgi:hypothetical protein